MNFIDIRIFISEKKIKEIYFLQIFHFSYDTIKFFLSSYLFERLNLPMPDLSQKIINIFLLYNFFIWIWNIKERKKIPL